MFLAVCVVNVTYLTEYLVCEVTIQNKKGYAAVVYRCPSQSTSEFESFLIGLKDFLNDILCLKSQCTVILGDLNTKSPVWWHGFKHLISNPAHRLPQSLSCNDLIFTDQPNYVIDCRTHPFLNPNCFHQIIFCKLDIKVEYLSPYQHFVGNFKKSNNEAIKKLLNSGTGTFSSQIKV